MKMIYLYNVYFSLTDEQKQILFSLWRCKNLRIHNNN